jgi:hypothetical protein
VIRTGTVLSVAAVILVGYAMFQVKYEVQQQEETLVKLDRRIAEGREAIRVLNAEWSYLTQPIRLDILAKRHLQLAPIGAAQLAHIEDIPMRGAAPPPAAEASRQPEAARPSEHHAPASATQPAARLAKINMSGSVER